MAKIGIEPSDEKKPVEERMIKEVLLCGVSEELKFPLAKELIQAGFPSPAEGLPPETLDLNQHLIKNPAGTYLLRVAGESMINAGVFPDDLLIVDKSIEAVNGDIVVAVLDGDFTVKRLFLEGNRCELRAENPDYPPILVASFENVDVWGVVRYVIHSL